MRNYIIVIILVLLMAFYMSACGSRSNTDLTSTNRTDSNEPSTVDVSPTGRSDGKSESTYVFFDNILYIRDYSRFTADDEDNAYFEVYSKKHTMSLLGEITDLDDNIPSKNFSAHEAQIGDKLYKDEEGNLFLMRDDGYLIALIPQQ